MRAICDRVGVKMPTLYHFFGNKQGLLDAVIEHGFNAYARAKTEHPSSCDPIADLRDGWDTHVRFGLDHPGFYALMYGQTIPHRRPDAATRPYEMLLTLCQSADRDGRLVVPAALAADHVLSANIGVTLFLITALEPDLSLSEAAREATIDAITGARPAGRSPRVDGDRVDAARALLHDLDGAERVLGGPETTLLRKWLTQLTRQ